MPENASSSPNASINSVSTEDNVSTENYASFLVGEKIALRLIARAEQYSRGLLNKLLVRGVEISIARDIINSLLERNLLNDQRYAELWIKSRLAGRRSPRQLINKLRNKGLDKSTSESAMVLCLDADSEYTLLCDFIEKNPESRDLEENYLKPRLKYEGFSLDSIDRYFTENR